VGGRPCVSGLQVPANSPDEVCLKTEHSRLIWRQVYPIACELFLDDISRRVRLPHSNLSSSKTALFALLDTVCLPLTSPYSAYSLTPRPKATPSSVARRRRQLRHRAARRVVLPLTEGHTPTFEIVGKLFPAEPRDFASQGEELEGEEGARRIWWRPTCRGRGRGISIAGVWGIRF
jgi:hypothetical protein